MRRRRAVDIIGACRSTSAFCASSLWPFPRRLPSRRYVFTGPLANGETVLFVGVDTPALEAGAAQALDGVAEELAAASTCRWRFVFGHHPFDSSGMHGGSEAVRRRLLPLLAAGSVDLYLCGHDHLLESMAAVDGVAEIVSGG